MKNFYKINNTIWIYLYFNRNKINNKLEKNNKYIIFMFHQFYSDNYSLIP